MKIMIVSDIHGSAFYCEKMLKAFKSENADKLLLLGDLLYHGPRNALPEEYNPQSVAEQLNAEKENILCVRGNCDADVDQLLLQFPIMAEYCILYSAGHMIFAAHGHNFNENSLPPLKKGDVLLNGHTHVAKYTEHKNYLYANPGSVAIPKEDTPHGYMILEDDVLIWKTLDGEVYNEYKLA